MLSDDDKKRIGGSDVAPILGLSEHAGPVDVWRRVVLGESTPENAAMRRGVLMEPVIREMVRAEHGLRLLGPRRLRDPKRPWVRCSLDDTSDEKDAEIPVELKSVSARAAYKLGEAEDDIPHAWALQVQMYLAESHAPRGRLFALIGVDDLRQYVIRADPELQAWIFEALERFWADHVLTKTPPPPDSSESYARYLTDRFPQPNGEILRATPEVDAWVRELRAADAEKAACKARCEEAKNRLKGYIGEARGVEGDGYRVLWSHVRGREAVDYPALLKHAGISDEEIARFTTRRAGYRAFRGSWKAADDE